MNYLEAANLLNLDDPFTLIQLKDVYRREIKLWHPDLYQSNPETLQKAEVRSRQINTAYDLLEPIAVTNGDARWQEHYQKKLPEWEREFKLLWRNTYWISITANSHPGLHLNTCIANFKRSAIAPRPEWFKHCLFPDNPKARSAYQQHLLKIAPNQQLREEWARKYFALEFGSGWIFYLPARVAMLRETAYA